MWRPLRTHFIDKLFLGALVLVPVFVTIFVLRHLFKFLDGILSPEIRRIFGFPIPGLGLVAVVILLYIAGLVASHYLGNQLIKLSDSLLNRIPFVRHIYHSTKQFLQAVTASGKMQFKRVVVVKYPHPGLHALGFVTGASRIVGGQRMIHVFIPHTPNPTSGMLEFIPEDEIQNTDLSIEAGIRMVISGGILTPEELKEPS